MAPRLRRLDLPQSVWWTAVQNITARLPGARPNVHDPVRMPDDVELVLHDEQGIAGGFQAIERPQQRFGVCRMQSGRRFIENVDHAE